MLVGNPPECITVKFALPSMLVGNPPECITVKFALLSMLVGTLLNVSL